MDEEGDYLCNFSTCSNNSNVNLANIFICNYSFFNYRFSFIVSKGKNFLMIVLKISLKKYLLSLYKCLSLVKLPSSKIRKKLLKIMLNIENIKGLTIYL